MKNFIQWIENSLDNSLNNPASSNVLRTGLQPQVNSEEIPTKQKEDQDGIMALDSHIQRIKEVTYQVTRKKSDKTIKIRRLVLDFVKEWENITRNEIEDNDSDGLGSYKPSENELEFMKNNQPLTDLSKSTIAGIR